VRLRLAPIGLSLLASGCVFYPKTVESYDPVCEIRTRQMLLKSEVIIDGICAGSTQQQAAAGCLVVALGMTAGSAVVSGSIVVAGNTVYWLEKRGKCIAKS
jgi:hypothetical protein